MHICCAESHSRGDDAVWQWDDVRFFLALARNRSLSGAARALQVDHATVGRRLAAFEDQMGTKLFDRTPEGFAITTSGQAILSQCEAMESSAAAVHHLAAGHDARLSGRVRIATTEMLAHLVVVPAIAGLTRRHPELQAEVMADTRVLDIARRQTDIAVRFSRPSDPNLVCRRLGDFALALYASPQYLAAHSGARGSPQGRRSVGYLGAPSWFREALRESPVALYSNSPFVQMKAVAEGIGIGLLACAVADSQSGLVRVAPDTPPQRRAIWLITPGLAAPRQDSAGIECDRRGLCAYGTTLRKVYAVDLRARD